MKTHSKKAIILPMIIFAALHTAAQSAIVSMVVTNGDGTYTYQYEVDNRSGSFDIFQWTLEFPFEKSLRDWNASDVSSGGDVMVALGIANDFTDDWEALEGPDTAGGFSQDFRSVDPFGGGDAKTGTRLGGFSLISSAAPGQVAYTEFGPSGESSTGFTTGPAVPIPEPCAPLLVTGSLLFALCHRKRF